MSPTPVRVSGAAWLALIGALRDDIELVLDRTVPLLLALPSYRGVDAEALRVGTRTNFLLVLDRAVDFGDPRDADEETLAKFTHIGEVRARQGIAVSDMAQGWRVAFSELHALARDLLQDADGSERLLLQLLETTLPWVDLGMLTSSEGHRQTELELSRQEHHARANFIRDLFYGALIGSQLSARAETFGLDTTQKYHAVRARPSETMQARHIERYLGTWDAGQLRTGLASLIDGDMCGVVRALPSAEAPGTFGVSAPVALHEMGPAFRHATRALETALVVGRPGVWDLTSLGLLPAVAGDHDVGDALIARYVLPLEALGTSGRTVLETVERYIVNDRRLESTGQELHVHPNTVRYRISRFEQETRSSLRGNVTLFEVWWALQRRALRHTH